MNGTWKDGDEGWEVDWCKELPSYPDDPMTIDRDGEKRVVRNFRTEDEAIAYADKVLSKAIDGDVLITPFVLERLDEDMPFTKEYTGDIALYIGDEES